MLSCLCRRKAIRYFVVCSMLIGRYPVPSHLSRFHSSTQNIVYIVHDCTMGTRSRKSSPRVVVLLTLFLGHTPQLQFARSPTPSRLQQLPGYCNISQQRMFSLWLYQSSCRPHQLPHEVTSALVVGKITPFQVCSNYVISRRLATPAPWVLTKLLHLQSGKLRVLSLNQS